MLTELKARVDALMETKDRVRTPAGVQKYGQPIGTLIVRDKIPNMPRRALAARRSGTKPKRSGVLRKTETYEGWDNYKDGDISYWVGKDPDQGDYVVVDENDKVLASGAKKTEAVAAMKDHYSKATKNDTDFEYSRNSKKPLVAMPRQQTLDQSKLKLAQSEREISDWVKKHKYSIPPNAEWVYLSEDPEAEGVQNAAYFYTREAAGRPKGKWQPRRARHAEVRNDTAKFNRVDKFRQDAKKIDAHLTQRRVDSDDTWAAIAMMRRLGVRVGTKDGKAENIGVTQLQVKHVTFPSDNVAMIRYTAKKGTSVEYETDDPLIVGLLRARVRRGKEARLFDTSDAATMRAQREITGGEYQNHDFRRLFATERAAAMVKATPPRKRPKTQAEFNSAVRIIADGVNEELQEKTKGVALKSYIDPRVFEPWRKATEGK